MKCDQCKQEFSSIAQHFALSECDYPDIPSSSMDIIIGCLLGDGHINISSKNGQFHLRLTNREALEYIEEKLPNWLVTPSGVHLDRTGEKSAKRLNKFKDSNYDCNNYYGLRTIRHPKFTSIRNNWYDDSRKIAPNRSYNSTEIKYWYITDGTISTHPNNKYKHKSMICAKNHIENGMSVSVFDKCPVKPSIYGDLFQFSVSDTEKFLDWVGRPVPGFEYKWDLSNRKT